MLADLGKLRWRDQLKEAERERLVLRALRERSRAGSDAAASKAKPRSSPGQAASRKPSGFVRWLAEHFLG